MSPCAARVTAVSQPSTLPASASAGGHGVHDDGAALLQPGLSVRQEAVAEQSSDVAAEASSEVEADVEGEGGRWQAERRRVQLEKGDLGGEQSSNSDPLLPLAATTHRKNHLAEGAESTLSAEAVATLIAELFVVGESEPRVSGQGPLVTETNKKLVKLAWAAIDDRKVLPQDRVNALSKSYGNFDRVVGWLLSAAVGLPLLSRTKAYDVGLKARREAGKIEKEEKKLKNDVSREKSKLLVPSEREELDRRLQKYMDTQLQEQLDVGLSTGSSPAPPPGPTGSRKRARPAAAAEPTQAELVAGAEAAVLEAEKALKKASKHAEGAEAKLSGPSSFQKYNHLLHKYYRAEFMLLHDQLALKGAELALSHTYSGEPRWSASSA